MPETVVLGDEAVALGAIDAGLSAAYAYPGTPATEILEYLIRHSARHDGHPHACWSINEKTAYEEAMGASLVGRRALVAMKHVGLNVAADPFMNSALVAVHGGLVLAVADDPGMHSSQNEQDSRSYAAFARIVCFEPANAQEAYDMTREAYDVSERFHLPVMVRLVTRLAHSRGVIAMGGRRRENVIAKTPDPTSWILLPAIARRRWRSLLERQRELSLYSAASSFNSLGLAGRHLGVITCGIGRNYLLENLADLDGMPSHLHIGMYPVPEDGIRRLANHVERILVLEDGYPVVERMLRGLLPSPLPILGRESGHLPPDGELDPDIVRTALGLTVRPGTAASDFPLPDRPPQLCAGCPHADVYQALRRALDGRDRSLVTSDIGCYTLGALPPYQAIETCVCMGASIGMAKGAADAGFHPAVAVIGDSTFQHSGITALADAAAADTNMTVLILDNEVVAMTGGQPSLVPSSRMEPLLRGIGVAPEHLHVMDAHPKTVDRMAEVMRREIDHPGLSVIVTVRECIETARARKQTDATRTLETKRRQDTEGTMSEVGC